MARITWQNVTAPDLSTSRAALQQAGNSLTSGFQGFADSFRDIEQQQKDAYSQEALARLAQVSDPNQLNALMASDGLAGLGVTDSRYLNADAMQSILSRPKALFDNQNTAMNTANLESQINRRDALLQGEKDQAAETLNFTKEQIKAAQQTYDYNEDANPEKLERLKTEIKQLESQMKIEGNQDTRAKEQWEEELRLAKLEQTQIIESNALNNEINAFASVEAGRKGWRALQDKINANPENYSQAIQDRVNLGPEKVIGDRLNAAKAYDAGVSKAETETTVSGWYNDVDKLGWNKEAFKEFAMRQFPQGSQALTDALAFITEREVRPINADFAADIANNEALSAAQQYLNEQQIQLEGKKLANPLYNASQILDGKDSLFKGSYTKLTQKLSENENALWGVNNAKVANFLLDFANKPENKNIPKDVIAMVILNGHAIDPRSAMGRVVPFRKDFTLNEKAIKAEVDAIMSAFDAANPDRLQSVLALRAEEQMINSKADKFRRRLESAGRAATGTKGYTAEDRNRIIAQAVLDTEADLGQRFTPEPVGRNTDIAYAPAPAPGSGNYDAALEAATQRQKEEADALRTPMNRIPVR